MAWLTKLFDLRPSESRPVTAAFGGLLFIVVAHTLLETARDALFLVHVGAGKLGWMYITGAAATLVAGALSSRIVGAMEARRALIATQIASAVGAAVFFALPPNVVVLTALYAFGAVSTGLLVPQLWATAAAMFHVGQARRLFGVIAVAGVLGAAVGTGLASLALLVLPLRALLLLSASSFVVASAFVRLAPEARKKSAEETASAGASGWWSAVRAEPVLARITLVVALGAATTLLVDYLFKAVASAHVAPQDLGAFFARYYTVTNLIALVVQLVAARRLLASAGVVGTVAFTPVLMTIGAALALVSGGAFLPVMAAKLVDATMRHSIHRTGFELVYLAVPSAARDRAKPIIDGAITRVSQGIAAGGVLVLYKFGRGTPRDLALVAAIAAACWLAAAIGLRRPYLALFRRALLGDDVATVRSPEELDLASVELLIEALSSPRAREVIAAMDALVRRGRGGVVPGLVLLRDETDVLVHALDVFGRTPRTDWWTFAGRLLSDKREKVQRSAMRALARSRGDVGGDVARPAFEDRPWVRGYLAIRPIADGEAGATRALAALITADDAGREARLGCLAALCDASASPALASTLDDIVGFAPISIDAEAIELVARAAPVVGAAGLAPWLIEQLALRAVRGPVRTSLVALGDDAYELVAVAIAARATPRRVRVQLPSAIAEFGTQRAANLLVSILQADADGGVRYKCLRSLERMVETNVVRLPIAELGDLAARELTESFRAIAVRAVLPHDDAHALLFALLDDKRRQAVDRALSLLKLCFPAEDVQRVRTAILSDDATRQANATEFLDALLAGRRRGPADRIRALLRILTEDLDAAERLRRAGEVVDIAAPASAEAALQRLATGGDDALAVLAREVLGPWAPRARDAEPDADAALSVASAVAIASVASGAHGR